MASERKALSKKRILVADDDRTTRFAIASMLKDSGYSVTQANDGVEALKKLRKSNFDLAFVDIWMPKMTGLEVLEEARNFPSCPKIIVMTSDNTQESVLGDARAQACEYLNKPFAPKDAVEIAERALSQEALSFIEIVSAKPEWVELLIPCTREAADRVHSFLKKLDARLPEEQRDTIGLAFRELLLNAVEWGGKLDPNRKVRIAYVRSSRLLLYRVADPGPGFHFSKLAHAAVGQPESDPFAHVSVRDQLGLRPGGFGIAMTRAIADELIYNEAQNEVLFIKYLTNAESRSA